LAGIYIHIPFCRQACHYCNFHFSTSQKLKPQVVQALHKEIQIKQDFFEPTTIIETIYFGGGTPSMLSKQEIEEILDALYENFLISNTVEVTLEANPDDLNPDYLKQLEEAGVTRLSIGIQTFQQDLLTYMNRAHNREQAVSTLEQVSNMDFDEVNIDLIYGVPGSSIETWQEDISFALQFQVDHISAYALTVEPKTALDHFIHKKGWPAPDDEITTRHFTMGSEFLESKGFTHYEVSNFAIGHRYSKHNTAYWKGKPYLGIGPSAHSFKGNERSWNVQNNAQYIKALADGNTPAITEILSARDQFNEYIMTGLRTMWGIEMKKIIEDFGEDNYRHIVEALPGFDPEHYNWNEDHLTLTKEGWLWSDRICSELFL